MLLAVYLDCYNIAKVTVVDTGCTDLEQMELEWMAVHIHFRHAVVDKVDTVCLVVLDKDHSDLLQEIVLALLLLQLPYWPSHLFRVNIVRLLASASQCTLVVDILADMVAVDKLVVAEVGIVADLHSRNQVMVEFDV